MGSLKLEQQSNRVNRWNSASSSAVKIMKNLTNESMDSGIAGVRGSPPSCTILPLQAAAAPPPPPPPPSCRATAVQQQQQQQQQQRPVTVDKQLVAQYIVDAASRTTYLKGRFLGKVNSIHLYFINYLDNHNAGVD